jgi:hypothetical protein
MTNPRLVTTGVTDPEESLLKPVQGGIDWLQYSVPWPDGLLCWPKEPMAVERALRSALPSPEGFALTGESLNPMPGYSGGMGANYARLFYHDAVREQHIGVIMSGDDLRAQIAIPYPQQELLAWVVMNAKKISRLDLAIDVFDKRADPADILASWKAGELVTPARLVQDFTTWSKDITGHKTHASTIYVGARGSERMLRVYDKAKQLGVPGPWTRIELQLRDRRAQMIARQCLGGGIQRVAQAAIREFCDVRKLGWWFDALRGPIIHFPSIKREDHDTFDWLMKAALPSIRRVLGDGVEWQREKLSEALRQAIETSKPIPGGEW